MPEPFTLARVSVAEEIVIVVTEERAVEPADGMAAPAPIAAPPPLPVTVIVAPVISSAPTDEFGAPLPPAKPDPTPAPPPDTRIRSEPPVIERLTTADRP
jgi:hypothetical protein